MRENGDRVQFVYLNCASTPGEFEIIFTPQRLDFARINLTISVVPENSESGKGDANICCQELNSFPDERDFLFFLHRCTCGQKIRTYPVEILFQDVG